MISIISKLKNTVSVGVDNIPVNIIKYCSHDISSPLVTIFNQCLSTGFFPDFLKMAKIIPVHKSGAKNIFTNYRPISLLTNFSKIFEKLLYTRLKGFLAKSNIPSKYQYGFQEKKSTAMAVLQMIDKITEAVDMKSCGVGLYVDLAKAFDTVDHAILLGKLAHYGVRGKQLEIFNSYLSGRKQIVDFNGVCSDTCSITHGVPQGSILGPLLFLVYIDDIQNCSSFLSFILFADDTNAFAMHNNIHCLFDIVNKELIALSTWFKVNKLSVNVAKTSYMFFTNCYNKYLDSSNLCLRLEGIGLENVHSIKFLGVTIDDKLSWRSNINHVSNIIARNSGVIKRIRQKITRKTALLLYDTLVAPHRSYCAITWASCYKGLLGKLHLLQKRAVRTILLVSSRTHAAPLFVKLKRLTIFDIHLQQLACFVYNCLNNTILSTVFSNYFVSNVMIHTHYTRGSGNLHCQFARTSLRSSSIRIAGPKFWNTLPIDTRNSASLDLFKKRVKYLLLSKYA